MSSDRATSAPIELRGISRAAFLVRGALATVAVYGSAAATSFVADAAAQATGSDIDLLGFLLTLEQVEAAFYSAALAKAHLSGGLKALATEIGAHESEHVTALTTTITELGGSAAPAPSTHFSVTDAGSFLRTAQSLEDTAVAAYNGVLPLFSSADLKADMASIAQVEARHAAGVRVKNHAPPAPTAFDRPISEQRALSAVRPFGG